jgi:hypothetical protein
MVSVLVNVQGVSGGAGLGAVRALESTAFQVLRLCEKVDEIHPQKSFPATEKSPWSTVELIGTARIHALLQALYVLVYLYFMILIHQPVPGTGITITHKVLKYIVYRAVSGVFRSIDPPPPLHPASVSSPRTNISEDARHWIGLLQYNPSTQILYNC